MDKEIKGKIWESLKFYKKNKTKIKVTYNRITVSGVIIEMHIWFCRTHVILDANGVHHKIFIDDISPGTIFPDETILQQPIINNSYDRKSIPKSIRNQIWRDRFGDQFYGKCDVCRNDIRRDAFEAGHVVSVKNGGMDTADNLRPICRDCNRSMGSENLKDFKKKHYSN